MMATHICIIIIQHIYIIYNYSVDSKYSKSLRADEDNYECMPRSVVCEFSKLMSNTRYLVHTKKGACGDDISKHQL